MVASLFSALGLLGIRNYFFSPGYLGGFMVEDIWVKNFLSGSFSEERVKIFTR